MDGAFNPGSIGQIGQIIRHPPAAHLFGDGGQNIGVCAAVHAEPRWIGGGRGARIKANSGQKGLAILFGPGGEPHAGGRLVVKDHGVGVEVVFVIGVVHVHVCDVLQRCRAVSGAEPRQVMPGGLVQVQRPRLAKPPEDQVHHGLGNGHDGMRLMGTEISGVAFVQDLVAFGDDHAGKPWVCAKPRHIFALGDGLIGRQAQIQHGGGAKGLHVS